MHVTFWCPHTFGNVVDVWVIFSGGSWMYVEGHLILKEKER